MSLVALLSFGLVLRAPPPRMAAGLRITGSGVEITEAMREHAEAKISLPLEKFASVLNEAAGVELQMKVEHRGLHDEKHAGRVAHICEVNVPLKGAHKTINVHSETEDMYSTIDEIEALLARKLRKAKEKQADKKIARGSKGKIDLEAETFDEAEDEEGASTLAASQSARSDAAAAAPAAVAEEECEPEDEECEVFGVAPTGYEWGEVY